MADSSHKQRSLLGISREICANQAAHPVAWETFLKKKHPHRRAKATINERTCALKSANYAIQILILPLTCLPLFDLAASTFEVDVKKMPSCMRHNVSIRRTICMHAVCRS